MALQAAKGKQVKEIKLRRRRETYRKVRLTERYEPTSDTLRQNKS